MRVRRKFLQLTRYTYPHGTEGFLKTYFPDGTKRDMHGNFYHVIGENPTAMFTCHLDTACSKQVKVVHSSDPKNIRTDGKSILGADDKAGMVVMLYMIEKKIPGLYYFFVGEEVGCVGSGKVSQNWDKNEFKHSINKVISFDRRGTCSVITHQFMGRCCSDKFAEELANRLNSTGQNIKLSPDNTGVLTDSIEFKDIIPECTNISVGFSKEHTNSETQDIEYLQRLCRAVCLIDWETLPIDRDPSLNDEEDDYNIFNYYSAPNFSEDFFSYFLIDGIYKKMYISIDLINQESEIIDRWLTSNGYSDTEAVWTGHKCYVLTTSGYLEFVGTRIDLMEMIPELASVPRSKLREHISN